MMEALFASNTCPCYDPHSSCTAGCKQATSHTTAIQLRSDSHMTEVTTQ